MRPSNALLLAGIAAAQITPVVYVTTYVTRCDCPATTLGVLAPPRTATAPTGLVVVAGQPAPAPSRAVVGGVPAAAPVPAGSTPGVAVAVPVPAPAPAPPVGAAPKPVAPAPVPAPAPGGNTSPVNNAAAPPAGNVAVTVAVAPAPVAVVPVSPAAIAPNGPKACPASAHQDFLGSKSYPRIITPVSVTDPAKVYGPQYITNIGNGNTTLLTYDFQRAGTCTLEFKFPTKEQILALQGTTDWTIGGPGGQSVPVTLYTLAAVADANASFQSKPARVSAVTGTLTPGTNTTLSTFACPVGKSVTYELVAESGQSLKLFTDYNPPPLGLLLLQC